MSDSMQPLSSPVNLDPKRRILFSVGDQPTPESLTELARFLEPLAREVGMAPLHPQTSLQVGYVVMMKGCVFIARDSVTRKIVGSLGLDIARWWYAIDDDPTEGRTRSYFLRDMWLYIDPAYRASGRVIMGLLRGAKKLGQERGQMVFITMSNPNKDKRPMALGGLGREDAQILGFHPFADVLRLH